MTSALLHSVDDTDVETALIVADLRKLNLGPNGDLDKSKFDVFFEAMNSIF